MRSQPGASDGRGDGVARKITAICDAAEPIVVAKFRDGDVRAASSNIEPTKNKLHWRPKWALEDGLHPLLEWIGEQPELPSEPGDHRCTRPCRSRTWWVPLAAYRLARGLTAG